jgi:hypothetical protein
MLERKIQEKQPMDVDTSIRPLRWPRATQLRFVGYKSLHIAIDPKEHLDWPIVREMFLPWSPRWLTSRDVSSEQP